MILAIDPGTTTGWALFETGVLSACGIGTPPQNTPSRVLIERPARVYAGIPVEDILALSLKAGEWHGIYRAHAPEYLTPNDWKGSTSKDTSHARIWRVLSSHEQGIVDRAGKGMAPGKRHNMMDAVGIGLHGVGRNANGR